MNIEKYEAWLKQAQPGDKITYYIGHLAADRGRYGPKMEWRPREPLNSLARRIYADMERGLVELTQKPGSIGGYRGYWYYATRTTKEM